MSGLKRLHVNTRPYECNICGSSEVRFCSNAIIYGRQYGSGYCYYCFRCKSYVGTHKNNPRESLGILATKDMRELKKKCHAIFDRQWSNKRERDDLYLWLADELRITKSSCHFGWADMDLLQKAYRILVDKFGEVDDNRELENG